MGKRKDFTDSKAKRKEREQTTKNKALRESKKQTQDALNKHRLGWKTRDGKEF